MRFCTALERRSCVTAQRWEMEVLLALRRGLGTSVDGSGGGKPVVEAGIEHLGLDGGETRDVLKHARVQASPSR